MGDARRILVLLSIALIALAIPAWCRSAEISIALPLQGHYRPGRAMPVRVTGRIDAPSDLLTLRARGAVTTLIPPRDGRIDATFAWLSIREITDVSWSIEPATQHALDLPLHPLEENERLIGYAGGDPAALKPMFANDTLIGVALDSLAPLPGPIAAWSALDGLVLDASAAARVSEAQLAGLLASGTVVAVISRARPGGAWPWQRRDGYWIVRAPVAGPTSAYSPAAYAPAQLWQRGWPADLRRHIVLAALLFTLLVTAATLFTRHAEHSRADVPRRRWISLMVVSRSSPIIVLLVCAAGIAGAWIWRSRQSLNIRAGGSILVVGSAIVQQDHWTYLAALRAASAEFALSRGTHPVFGYRGQSQQMNLQVVCDASGNARLLRYRLLPGQLLAIQSRTVRAERRDLEAALPIRAGALPITSPLRGMAEDLYVGAGDRVAGQMPPDLPEDWDAVIIRRGGP